MRQIAFQKVVDTVSDMCARSAAELPADVLSALVRARENETSPGARQILETLIQNNRIASQKKLPLCQDTGLAVFFVDIGSQVAITPPKDRPDATLTDAVNEGLADATTRALLRNSIVEEPLNQRKNTGTNTPAVVHYQILPGDKLHIAMMAKGGGCENKSMFKMFNPTAPPEDIIEWVIEVVTLAGANACPPFVVGLGLGGNFEQSCLISKKALLRKIGEHHPDNFYAEMEKKLLEKINATGMGPQAMAGKTTALAVNIETAPCHIASLPAAVNIECHSHRHAQTLI